MALDQQRKKEITEEFQLHEKDTGSADVQIAILTESILELTEHLKEHPKDAASRLALMKLVGTRRRLLNYLSQTNGERHQKVCRKLNIRR